MTKSKIELQIQSARDLLNIAQYRYRHSIHTKLPYVVLKSWLSEIRDIKKTLNDLLVVNSRQPAFPPTLES